MSTHPDVLGAPSIMDNLDKASNENTAACSVWEAGDDAECGGKPETI